jgi:hypothetical protein
MPTPNSAPPKSAPTQKQACRQHHGLGEVEPARQHQGLRGDHGDRHGEQEAAQARSLGLGQRILDGAAHAEARPARQGAEAHTDGKGRQRDPAVRIQRH